MRGIPIQVYGKNAAGAYGTALVAHGHGQTPLSLWWEGRWERYVWRTPTGTSIESGKNVRSALDRLRALYATAAPEGIPQTGPYLIEGPTTFPPTEDDETL